MAEASIPVDLFNPGQVFACLGFLEAAEVLIGDAEGAFDWHDRGQSRFMLQASGEDNPFDIVLRFLASARIHAYGPTGYRDPTDQGDDDVPSDSRSLKLTESFPSAEGDPMSLPIELEMEGHPTVRLGHWTDGSRRETFKLYSGNRSAFGIASAMLRGTRKNPGKNQSIGDLKTFGLATLWETERDRIVAEPFDVLTPMGGSFNFDPRGAWTAIDAGYSPNQHKHGIAASPVVEILAAWGLEHARPDEYATRKVRYSTWGTMLPPMLARAALASASIAIPSRRFHFELALSGKNKVVTFAEEETRS